MVGRPTIRVSNYHPVRIRYGIVLPAGNLPGPGRCINMHGMVLSPDSRNITVTQSQHVCDVNLHRKRVEKGYPESPDNDGRHVSAGGPNG